MGPESAKTYPGQAVVETKDGPGRAKQEIDYGRRGKGYIFGAFQPATGEAFTRPYLGRSTASWVAFLEEVERWLPAEGQRIYAIIDNLSTHRAPDVLLFLLTHPRWEMVFQPKYAAYLNLIEPWWKVLRSLALTRRAAQQKVAGSRPGPRSSRRLNAPPPTGMSTSIPSSGDAVGAIGKPAGSVSPLSPPSH
jgi:hypothetical protein